MGHLPDLIRDLALILMAGAITTLIFKRIRQPLVLGYIIAGFLVGPYFKMLPTIGDAESVEIWAEIGVIFLLFSLGLSVAGVGLLAGAVNIAAALLALATILIYGVIYTPMKRRTRWATARRARRREAQGSPGRARGRA